MTNNTGEDHDRSPMKTEMDRSKYLHTEIARALGRGFGELGITFEDDHELTEATYLLSTCIMDHLLTANGGNEFTLMVPLEPTTAMTKCGGDVLGGKDDNRASDTTAKAVWAAMIGVVKRMTK